MLCIDTIRNSCIFAIASSAVSLQSHPLRNISSPQLNRSAADHVSTDDHCRLSDVTQEWSRDDMSAFSTSGNLTTDDLTASPDNHHAVETSASATKSTSSDGRANMLLKLRNGVDQTLVVETLEKKSMAISDDRAKNLLSSHRQSNKRTHGKVSEAANETLVAENGDVGESVRPGSNQLKNKRAFSTFSVSLTREKIEADLLAMVGGSKRTRRAKKRPRNVQRQLDDLFPGLRLKYITPDNYRVRDH